MTQVSCDTSIVICAYTEDRWEIFVKAVESAQNQTPSPGEVVIVIDHNPKLLARTRECFPHLLVIENSQPQGLSGARNTGIAASHGRLIAFLDDDAVAEPDWLALLVQWCEQPNVLGAGSFVEPLWMVERPRWFPDEFYWTVGCSYRGLPQKAAQVRNPSGGSMCLRRELFEAVGDFRVGIGRVGTIPLGCEETELCIRAKQHWPQGTFMFEPRARIHHQITAPRATWKYFRARCYAEGLSKALISRFVGAKDGLGSERNYTTRVLPIGVLNGLRDMITRGDLSGLTRAWAITSGLLITTFGYLKGRASPQVAKLSVEIAQQGQIKAAQA